MHISCIRRRDCRYPSTADQNGDYSERNTFQAIFSASAFLVKPQGSNSGYSMSEPTSSLEAPSSFMERLQENIGEDNGQYDEIKIYVRFKYFRRPWGGVVRHVCSP